MKKRRQSSLTQNAIKALKDAVAKALEEHRRLGIPIAVWRDGRAVSIPAGPEGALREPPTPYRTKAHGTKS